MNQCYRDPEQDIESLLGRTQQDKLKNGKTKLLTWPEQISKIFPVRHPLIFWIILPEVLFLGQYIIVKACGSSAHGMLAFAIYLGILGYLALLIPFCAKQLLGLMPALSTFIEADKLAVQDWFLSRLKRLYSFRSDAVAFAILGPFLTASLLYVTNFFRYEKPWFGNRISDLYALVAFLLFSLLGAHHIRFIISVIAIMKQISRLPIKVTIYQHPVNSVRAVGRVMFVVAMNGAVALALCYLGVFVSPAPLGWIIVFWMVAAGLLLLALFILPQYEIHKIMTDVKNTKMLAFSPHVEAATAKAIEEPTNENIERFEKMFLVQDRLTNCMHEWPFDGNAMFALLSAVIIPVIIAIIQLAF